MTMIKTSLEASALRRAFLFSKHPAYGIIFPLTLMLGGY